MPHIHCYLGDRQLVWTMITTDFLIGMAYVGISLTLWALVRKIQIQFNLVALCFGLFIAACGATHFMEIWTLWNPDYWVAACVKVITAIASVGTGIYLFQLRHAMVSVAIAAKLSEKRRLDLEALTQDLETRIAERTAEAQKTSFRYKTLTEALPQLVWSCLPDGRCDYLSKQWADYTGVPLENQLGFGWLSGVIHPDDQGRTEEHWMGAVRGLHAYDTEYRIRRYDGVFRWFKTRGTPIHDEMGEINYWFGTCTDIEDHKLTEEALRESTAMFEAIANTIPQLAWMTNADGYIKWYNQNWYDYTGTTLEEMRGWGWKLVHDPAYLENVTEKWARHLKTGEDWEDTFPLKGKNGEWRWFLSRAKASRDVDGSILYWLGTNTDITEQRKYREQLLLANQAKDELLSICSHELKTPISAMRLSTQMVLRGFNRNDSEATSPDRIKRMTQQSIRQLDRLTHLVDEILDFSRISGGKLKLKLEPYDMSKLLSEVVDRMTLLYEAMNTKFSFNFPHSPVVGVWDQLRLEQVFINLLSNALKYGQGKPVHIELQDLQSEVIVIVTDEGLGISPADQSRIFLPYERAVSHMNISGLGMGLYISSQIVEAHGGTILIESSLGKGSVFTVKLPKFSPP